MRRSFYFRYNTTLHNVYIFCEKLILLRKSVAINNQDPKQPKTTNRYYTMDLRQKKLSKDEWLNIEIAVSDREKGILQLIIDGYRDINLRRNDTQSLIAKMKIDDTLENQAYLYKQYFEKEIQSLIKKYPDVDLSIGQKEKPIKKVKVVAPPKKADLIRINSMDAKMKGTTSGIAGSGQDQIFEFALLDFCKEIMQSLALKTAKYAFYLYTLIQIMQSTIQQINPEVVDFVQRVIRGAEKHLKMRDVLVQAYQFIEKNPHLIKYEDQTLFAHQKELFSIFRQESGGNNRSKLVLYIAPTGTGKTLSPIALSVGHRIIFICAARHVGLALAKSAVSMGKKIAIAFGCETADDIRLHYFAASVYTRNQRTGGIGKVDNSVGDKVEIMICDVQSYLVAMYYMLAFNTEPEIVTYWDEPTITMDYEEHPLHAQIHRNWEENRISKVVLSSATLPREEELAETIDNFRQRFISETGDLPEIHTITSHDCRKSIGVLNKGGKAVVPHLLFRDIGELKRCATYCDENKTLLRYFDLQEIVRFIQAISDRIAPAYQMEQYFAKGIADISMKSLKKYYLDLLLRLDLDLSAEVWHEIHDALIRGQIPKFRQKTIERTKSGNTIDISMGTGYGSKGVDKMSGLSLSRTQSMMVTSGSQQSLVSMSQSQKTAHPFTGVLLTTADAHTLTDGPTIFLTEDVEKIGQFYIQQTNIPTRVFQEISEKIAKNNEVQIKITELSNKLEDQLAALENREQSQGGDGPGGKSSKKSKTRELSSTATDRLKEQIDILRSYIKVVSFDRIFIPNTQPHQEIWVGDTHIPNAFTPYIEESVVCEIMELDVTDQMKILLLLGVGMFLDEQAEKTNAKYMEIMKRLAYQQKLFLILASSDYIYGTNYQFCHGFIGKDLQKMTQQKTIQAMGRIGRNQIQQEYTVRFRDDAMLIQLFSRPVENREATIMGRLFGH